MVTKSLKDQECHAIIVCDTESLKDVMAKKFAPGIRTDLHPELAGAISRSHLENIEFIEYIQTLPGFNGWQCLMPGKTTTVYEQIVLASLDNEEYFSYVQKQPYFTEAMNLLASRNVIKNYLPCQPVVQVLHENNWIKLDKSLFLSDTFRLGLSIFLTYGLENDCLNLNQKETMEVLQKSWWSMPMQILDTFYEKKPFLYDLTLPEAINVKEDTQSAQAYKELSNVTPNRFEVILNNHSSTIEDLIELTSGWYQPLSVNQHENYITLFNHLKKYHEVHLPDYFQKIEQDLQNRDKVEDSTDMDDFAKLFGKVRLYYKIESEGDSLNSNNNSNQNDDNNVSPKMKI